MNLKCSLLYFSLHHNNALSFLTISLLSLKRIRNAKWKKKKEKEYEIQNEKKKGEKK